MTLITWIAVGAVAGFVASYLVGGRDSLLMMIILGIVGAIVGGWVAGTWLNIANVTGFNLTSVVVAVIGALIVIVLANGLTGRRRSFGR